MQESITSELKRAQSEHLETDVLLEGGTLYPRLIVNDFTSDGAIRFYDAEGATITLEDNVIRGVVVDTTPPKWHFGKCEQHQESTGKTS